MTGLFSKRPGTENLSVRLMNCTRRVRVGGLGQLPPPTPQPGLPGERPEEHTPCPGHFPTVEGKVMKELGRGSAEEEYQRSSLGKFNQLCHDPKICLPRDF